MPRRPKLEKRTITIIVNGSPVKVILHPPSGSRKSWYAYWSGLVASKSTGQTDINEAVKVVEEMLQHGGKCTELKETGLSDEEFEAVQRVHYGRKQDPAAKARAEKSLFQCLNAITAFRAITGLKPITVATADDCAGFSAKALTLPKNWRRSYPRGKKDVERVSPNTVLKWSRALQAAFERANRNAFRRKCVRGVVAEGKLLDSNPWNQFPWIEGRERPIRQFDGEELLAFLEYLKGNWAGLTVAQAIAKVCLWSSGRRAEVMALTWPSLRIVGDEYHFQVVGKWGVERWFRIPESLYQELLAIRTSSPYVFAAYNDQLRRFYERSTRPGTAKVVGVEFDPVCLGDWFHERIVRWSKYLPKGQATTHIFRKTGLQYARHGEDVNRQVAEDARVSAGVMMTSYVKETDPELREASNRTFSRILAGLSPEVARGYGYTATVVADREQRLQAAIAAKDWQLVSQLSADLASEKTPPTG